MDYIRISKTSIYGSTLVSAIDTMFDNDEVVVNIGEERMTIGRLGIDSMQKDYKLHGKRKGWRAFTYTGDNIFPKGNYPIDTDESTEDELVIYMEDKI